ncbi:MAG: hypothetical protein AAB432_00745 [Patescibacteria group bacterium]
MKKNTIIWLIILVVVLLVWWFMKSSNSVPSIDPRANLQTAPDSTVNISNDLSGIDVGSVDSGFDNIDQDINGL